MSLVSNIGLCFEFMDSECSIDNSINSYTDGYSCASLDQRIVTIPDHVSSLKRFNQLRFREYIVETYCIGDLVDFDTSSLIVKMVENRRIYFDIKEDTTREERSQINDETCVLGNSRHIGDNMPIVTDCKQTSMLDENKSNETIAGQLPVKTSSSKSNTIDESTSVFEIGTAEYSYGNPNVETIEGILHIYKANQQLPLENIPATDTLYMLGIPAKLFIPDLLDFIAPMFPSLIHIKVVRDAKPNQYQALLKFHSSEDAMRFYKMYNGYRFNTLEPEVCHLAFVAFVHSSELELSSISGLTELPTCHVCLEKMDESVSGILTVLCNHSFHTDCINRWRDIYCPVCRFHQSPLENHTCDVCGATDPLWMCIICGHIGCGRYNGGHAVDHFHETDHTYSLEIESQNVWDYVQDQFVHRLIQSKSDGKPVEFTTNVEDEKFDSLKLEYSYLVTSHLEQQRHFFEGQISNVKSEAASSISELKELLSEIRTNAEALAEKLDTVAKEKCTVEKKFSNLLKQSNKLAKNLSDEQEMNKALRSNQKEWLSKVVLLESEAEAKHSEVVDLKEQLRDAFFFIEAKQKIGNETQEVQSEIQEGKIEMDVSVPSVRRKTKKNT